MKTLLKYANSGHKKNIKISIKNCNKKHVGKILSAHAEIARQLGVKGVPLVLIGNKIIRGARLEAIAEEINRQLDK